MRKKLIAAIIGATSIMSAAGCGGSEDDAKNVEAVDISTEPTATPIATPTTTPFPTTSPEEFRKMDFVANDNVNIRSEPGTDSEVIYSLSKGDRVTVTGEAKEGWYSVEMDVDGETVSGYAARKYISRVHKLDGDDSVSSEDDGEKETVTKISTYVGDEEEGGAAQ